MKRPDAARSLEKSLGDFLARGPHKPGDLIESERELTDRFGVSRTTVRAVLARMTRQGILVSEPGRGHRLVRRRKPKAAPSARADLFVPELRNPFYASLASHVSELAAQDGVDLCIHDYRHRYGDLPERVAHCQAEASPVLLHFPGTAGELAALIRAVKPPLILIHPLSDLAPKVPFDQVLLDSFGGGRRAMEHLLSIGRRRIAYVGLPNQATERFRGAQAALRERGAPGAALHAFEMDLPGYHGAVEAVGRALKGEFPFDGLLCANDDIALGVLRALAVGAVAVPAKVAVVGYDDLDEAARIRPSLSTIRQDTGHLARLAWEMIRFPRHQGPPRCLTLPNELLVRESTLPTHPFDPMHPFP